VYRQRLQVERDLLAGETDQLATPGQRRDRDEARAPVADRVVALSTAVALALDAVVQAARLTRSRSRR
jgi:hypothetical protein